MNTKVFLKAVALLFLIQTSLAKADRGNGSGGGGNELVAEFISSAKVILNLESLAQSPDLPALQNALTHAKIVSVRILNDLATGKPVPNQKSLVAWGSKDSIQLKEDSGVPGESSWEHLLKSRQPVAHFVLHELYRATGLVGTDGKSVDENFQISIGRFHLDKLQLIAGSDVKLTNDTIIMTGYFPSENIEDSFAKALFGAQVGTCTSDHNSGYEGFALNFRCIGKDARLNGRAGVTYAAGGAHPAFVWNMWATLNLFEGPERWVNIEYGCSKLNLEAMVCEPTGKKETHSGNWKSWFPVKIGDFGDGKFYLIGLQEMNEGLIPCDVKMTSRVADPTLDGVEVKCVSARGVFVGKTKKNATNRWDLEGELSEFSGPGNFIKMEAPCHPSKEKVEIPGSGSTLDVKADCPASLNAN